jgi:hypothetical protein
MKYLNIGGILVEKDSAQIVAATAEEQVVSYLFQLRLIGLREPKKVVETLGKIKTIRTMKT